MTNPALPTNNNIYKHQFLYELIKQIRGVGSVLNSADVPALPTDANDDPINTESGYWYAILEQLKHFGDNLVFWATGKTAAYPVTTDGAQVLLDAAPFDRTVMIHVKATAAFADGSGAQPVFTIGETGAADKFTDGSDIAGASAGAKFTYAGELTADTDLIVTATAGTGTATGALAVTAQATMVEA